MLAALMAFAACTNEIEIIEADNEPVVILNGLIDASSRIHHVHLSEGSGKNVNALYKAKVKCFVNGVYVSDGEVDDVNKVLSAPYRFEAELKEGDVVRIETDKGVSAEAVVPKAPLVTGVDTVVVEPSEGNTEGAIRFRITLNDIPDEDSFYMADIEGKKTHTFIANNGEEVAIKDSLAHFLESDNDPLLNEGRSEDDSDVFDDILEMLFGYNQYNVFSDNTFKNRSYTLRTKVGYSYLRDDRLIYSPLGYPVPYAYTESVARLKIFGFDKTTFRYIKSVNASWTLGSYVITTPVIIPVNVENGLGYFAVMNPGIREVRFPRKKVPVVDEYYPTSTPL